MRPGVSAGEGRIWEEQEKGDGRGDGGSGLRVDSCGAGSAATVPGGVSVRFFARRRLPVVNILFVSLSLHVASPHAITTHSVVPNSTIFMMCTDPSVLSSFVPSCSRH